MSHLSRRILAASDVGQPLSRHARVSYLYKHSTCHEQPRLRESTSARLRPCYAEHIPFEARSHTQILGTTLRSIARCILKRIVCTLEGVPRMLMTAGQSRWLVDPIFRGVFGVSGFRNSRIYECHISSDLCRISAVLCFCKIKATLVILSDESK